MTGRRSLLAAASGCAVAIALPGIVAKPARADGFNPQPASRDWATFKARFVAPEGRVVDTGNGLCSHTEGQGYGMLLAVAHDDQATFDRLLAWTGENLGHSTDSLHSWRYLPRAANHVPDRNNATDGDLLIALALARAGHRWGRLDNLQAAAAIGRDVLRLLVRNVGTTTVLLPGAFGFDKPAGVVVNLSYYMFPALNELEALVPSPVWAKLRHDGLRLIADARFGRWKLPPDWLFVSARDGSLAPAPGWPPRFSYDAIRVPLHMTWANLEAGDLDAAFADYWSSHSPTAPAWVDLTTNETATYAVNAGQAAVAMLATQARQPGAAPSFPDMRAAGDYYAAALLLLAKLAWQETQA